jgi:Spy/CpxP family protein refolding chaperone
MPPYPPFWEQLNLTDAQKDKIENLRFNHQKEMIDLRADLQLKMLEMRKLRSGENLSRDKMIDLTKEINEIRNKMSLARTNHQMDIYEVLDNTQKKIWNENRPFRNWKKDRGMFRPWRNFCW